ncbi:MAG: substrate-binding domain-containing protein [Kiritimatiellae bacterium]|nr:substrate-binding domain-containing protein [Kiritimatiellia bacterium]
MTSGILLYVARHPDVEVMLYGPGTAYSRLDEFREWKPDGLISNIPVGAKLGDAMDIGIRAIVLPNVEPSPKCPIKAASVFCDNDAVAATAFAHFAARGLKHLAYVGAPREYGMFTRSDGRTIHDERLPRRVSEEPVWSRLRGDALRRCAENGGCSFAAYASDGSSRRKNGASQSIKALAEWLAALSKPCGILAANDMRAKETLDACALAGIAVPVQALVLGVDNEEFICRQTRPTLSSVITDCVSGGYIEAETLVALLRGRERRLPRREFGVVGVARRLSTSDPHDARVIAERADAFIKEHAADDIRLGDIAKAAFASKRLLQMDYKAAMGQTVSEAILNERLRRVCDMLLETATPIGEIGPLCGFGSAGYLQRLFRSRFGCTMRDWRKDHR